ncbi:glycine zipper 2TM domain-containing protein [Pseudoalteromonas sp. MMG010]|uniref:glycine zipper 2TM domain-containing protein n=1 Tax=Pseudoalteromonas sp. MMG010 TaxID=2822685 RepID=UPI001B3A6477|nr:glycine zipper 2TM domain-containing protein [Pseudoalteromonas sp. MMG010]MBQ4832574.1 glycine zipper 2TM domain-containing protein [Pseudoalteromonas sp. MMG010]
MKKLNLTLVTLLLMFSQLTYANYNRNKAVPVQKVLFGEVLSVRNISQRTLLEDKKNNWQTFGGALLGGAIGHQFGSGSGRKVATILGAIVGGNIAHNSPTDRQYMQTQLVELFINVGHDEQYMVIQEKDNNMQFKHGDSVRLVYLSDNTVRVDQAY